VAGEPERRGSGPLQDVSLDAAGIQLLAESRSHYLFARDNLMALVERLPEGFGSIGGTGILTERGLAYLVWRDGQAFLAGKGFEQPATDHQVEAVRRFSEDLKAGLPAQ
jgi:hypothetical protein